MKKLITLLCLTLICFDIGAQTKTNQKKLSLKVSNLATIYNPEKLTNPSYYNRLYNQSQFLKPTISVQWQNAKSYCHEFEITNYNINKVEQGKQGEVGQTEDPYPPMDISKTSISLRYEFIYQFSKSDKRWQPELGIAINPYFIKIENKPGSTNFFPETNRYSGARLNLVPRINYFPGKKVFIDINIPINLFDFNYHSNKISNPSIEISNQTQTYLETVFLPKVFNFRLGLGIRL